MSIELNSEQQKMIDAAIRSGAYADAGQVIAHALEVLSAEDEWLRVRRHTINEKISRGLAQLDPGEGIAGDEALKNLQERRAALLEQNPQQA